nr:MAG TPA: hypothetical protein [Caudoviricetes sp.]
MYSSAKCFCLSFIFHHHFFKIKKATRCVTFSRPLTAN